MNRDCESGMIIARGIERNAYDFVCVKNSVLNLNEHSLSSFRLSIYIITYFYLFVKREFEIPSFIFVLGKFLKD